MASFDQRNGIIEPQLLTKGAVIATTNVQWSVTRLCRATWWNLHPETEARLITSFWAPRWISPKNIPQQVGCNAKKNTRQSFFGFIRGKERGRIKYLGGGLNQPIWKIWSSNWIISAGRGENQYRLLRIAPSNPSNFTGNNFQKKHSTLMKDTEVRSSGLTLLPTTAMERPHLGAFNSLTMVATEAIFPFRIQNALHLVGRQITYHQPPQKKTDHLYTTRANHLPPMRATRPPPRSWVRQNAGLGAPENKHQVVDTRWVMASQPTPPPNVPQK